MEFSQFIFILATVFCLLSQFVLCCVLFLVYTAMDYFTKLLYNFVSGTSSSKNNTSHALWPEMKTLIKSENAFNIYQSFPNPRNIQKSFQDALITLHSLGLSAKKLPAPGEPTWPCIGCGKTYRSKTSLSLHRRVECGKEPTLKCQYCLRMFHHNSSLIRHIRVIHRDILAMMARNQTI